MSPASNASTSPNRNQRFTFERSNVPPQALISHDSEPVPSTSPSRVNT